jgi:hypothetical protein
MLANANNTLILIEAIEVKNKLSKTHNKLTIYNISEENK